MSPEIIAREQNKDTHLKEVMKKSDKSSERIVERSTVTQKEDSMVVSYIPTTPRYNKNGSYTKTKSNMAQPQTGCGSWSKELSWMPNRQESEKEIWWPTIKTGRKTHSLEHIWCWPYRAIDRKDSKWK
jgi:hypothetical protein